MKSPRHITDRAASNPSRRFSIDIRNPPNPVSYKDAARDHLETLKTRVADLAELSRRWEAQLQIPDAELPHPKTDLRITPRP